ncbi:MAG: aminopeptidase [Planctomycetota bacterium]|jgi:aminopeptidase
MHDPRFDRLAELLVSHSTRLTSGEHLLVESFDAPDAFVAAVVKAARARGAHPHAALRSTRVLRTLVDGADEAQIDAWADIDAHRMKAMDAYIGVRGGENASEMASVDEASMSLFGRRYQKPVHFEERVKRTKWCVLRWPTPSMAQLAGMSTDEFEDFYFRVCCLDYGRMSTAATALVDRMNRTERVHILGPGDTDLRFSIKDIPAVACCGEMNIPDGEVFTAPVRDSIEGVVAYNTATIYHGVPFENVRLGFEKGRIVESSATVGGDRLEEIFDADEGARFVGEFAIGFHPHILHPMKDILFDEKIAGSFHFTPGQAYDEADNGNRSEIHWDLVCIQRPDFGGGEIRFDDETIRKDGLFVTDDLVDLNPDRLG